MSITKRKQTATHLFPCLLPKGRPPYLEADLIVIGRGDPVTCDCCWWDRLLAVLLCGNTRSHLSEDLTWELAYVFKTRWVTFLCDTAVPFFCCWTIGSARGEFCCCCCWKDVSPWLNVKNWERSSIWKMSNLWCLVRQKARKHILTALSESLPSTLTIGIQQPIPQAVFQYERS